MPLTAKSVDCNYITSLDLTEKDRKEDYYMCRHCGEEMRIVLSTRRVKHFRHLSKGECNYKSEGVDHLETKAFFHDYFERADDVLYTELEEHLGNRIADVVAYPKDTSKSPVVVEVQNSNISISEIRERYNDYNKMGFGVVWVITKNIDIRKDWVWHIYHAQLGKIYRYKDNKLEVIHFGNGKWLWDDGIAANKKDGVIRRELNEPCMPTAGWMVCYPMPRRMVASFGEGKAWDANEY